MLGKGLVRCYHMHDYTSFFFLPCHPTSPFLSSQYCPGNVNLNKQVGSC